MGDDKDLHIKIFDRLGQIDGKLTGLEDIRARANTAFDNSNKALTLGDENEKRIDSLRNLFKWWIGLMASTMIPFVIFVLGYIFT